jgi:hypothetical protein
VPASCTVLIAAPHLLPALTRRASASGDEVIAFADGEALRALEQIIQRRPHRVALERTFAITTRGAALINRIKADPALTQSEIRVVTPDTEPPAAMDPVPASATTAPEPASLDGVGTRRLPRQPLAGAVEITIDGNSALLVDLSPLGAQVVSPTVLRPNQRIRLGITDRVGTVRVSGSIAWATFEIPPGSGPRYRAGVEFLQPDTAQLEAFCRRHH